MKPVKSDERVVKETKDAAASREPNARYKPKTPRVPDKRGSLRALSALPLPGVLLALAWVAQAQPNAVVLQPPSAKSDGGHAGAPLRLKQPPRLAQIAEPRIWPPRPVPPVPLPVPRPLLDQELQLVSQAARVDISGALARTRLTQTFQNTTNRTIEGTYIFPLPEGAAVSGFAMTVNGKRTEAEILDGDRAREIYTGIVQKMRDPAILEFIDRNLVRARIFPIAPRAEQKIELEYSESLKAEGGGASGGYRFVVPLRLPTGGAAQTASVDIRIRAEGGVRAVYSPTHEVEVKRDGDTARVSGEFGTRDGTVQPVAVTGDTRRRIVAPDNPINRTGSDRDFVLYFTTARGRVGVNLVTHKSGGEDGYFMLLAAPDATVSPQEIAAKDVVFVFDTSGSMSGEKIEQARRALLNLLGNLNERDFFNIVTFSSDVRPFRDRMTPVSAQAIDAARDFARDIKAVGGTNINDALLEALKLLPTSPGFGRPQQIVFMTDGQPTVGETDVAQILKNVREANTGKVIEKVTQFHPARLFVFGVGFDVNTRLLDTLAEDNRGASDYVLPQEDIEAKVGSLYSKIAYPVLSNPRLDWGGMKVYDVYPRRLPDLFRGTQTVVFGRYSDSGNAGGAARVQLIGTASGREERIAGGGSFGDAGRFNDTLPRLWAMRKVGFLLDDARRESRPVADEVRDEIIKLSKRYGIVTPFTAGLITEDEAPAPGAPVDLGGTPFALGGMPAPVTRQRGERGAASGFGGMGGGGGAGGMAGGAVAGPAGPADNSGMMRAGASGPGAVAASKQTNELRETQKLKEQADVRYVEGKAFFLKDGVWTDSAFDAAKSPKSVTIKFASPQYFALLKDARVAKWLSVGERVVLVLKDRTVKIEP